jgi:hypothetical protein
MVENRRNDDEEWDVGGLAVPVFLLAVLSAVGLGTKPGNRFMCQQAIAPTFIDCAKAEVTMTERFVVAHHPKSATVIVNQTFTRKGLAFAYVARKLPT